MKVKALRAAFQGEAGAYSDLAARKLLGEPLETLACASFDRVFEAVESGAADHGVVPIENSLAGTIHRNYDLVQRHSLRITGELLLPVSHCLIARPGAQLSEISLVRSHPQALAQCERRLAAMGLRAEAAADTAGSVKEVAASNETHVAAIASEWAARVYGMEVLATKLQDWPHNYTRFWLLSRPPGPTPGPGPQKVSIAFSLRSGPGALFKALAVFALRDLDLTKLESRPIPDRLWEYRFYLDFISDDFEGPGSRAIEHLREITGELTVLGRYRSATIDKEVSDD